MPLQTLDVKDIVSVVQPGDILAFSGKGNIVSDLVRLATGSIVSHVGIILNSQDGTTQPKIIESTSLGGFRGVTVSDLVTRCTYSPGLIWYLPLALDLQRKVDGKKLEFWLLQRRTSNTIHGARSKVHCLNGNSRTTGVRLVVICLLFLSLHRNQLPNGFAVNWLQQRSNRLAYYLNHSILI